MKETQSLIEFIKIGHRKQTYDNNYYHRSQDADHQLKVSSQKSKINDIIDDINYVNYTTKMAHQAFITSENCMINGVTTLTAPYK